MPKKKVKKITIANCDEQWSLGVKERDGFKCRVKGCKKTTYLNSHHIFSRSNRSTRWYIPNGITLCSGHHTLNSSFSAHKTPLEFTYFLEDLLGEDFLNELRQKAHSVDKRKLDEIYLELTRK